MAKTRMPLYSYLLYSYVRLNAQKIILLGYLMLDRIHKIPGIDFDWIMRCIPSTTVFHVGLDLTLPYAVRVQARFGGTVFIKDPYNVYLVHVPLLQNVAAWSECRSIKYTYRL